jgi:hypothetical protein
VGIDKSLWDPYPSVIINGSKYHYGRTKEYGNYLVEHESIAKDSWSFKEKEDLQAFLINLPESADRNKRLKLHPDWRDVTPEQRDIYFEQDKLLFRAMAEEKLRDGTAQSFNMDLEGEQGPYEPQRIESRSKEPPIERVERQLQDWKTYRSWEGSLSEAGKLRVLEGELDWTGVDAKDKEILLAREVDFTRVTPKQFAFVYANIASDKLEPADDTVARTLFEQSQPQAEGRAIRPATKNLVEAVLFDVWPRNAAIVDFGIRSQEHYEALYYPLRDGDITPEQVDAALGNGRKLTELVNAAPHNPHKGIEFHTSWDDLLPQAGNHEDGGKQTAQRLHLWPSEIAKANQQKQTGQDQGNSGGKEKSNGKDDGHSM